MTRHDIELRFNPQPAELRAGPSGRRIGGLAAPFGKKSQVMNGIREVIEPSMWSKSRGDGWPGVLAKLEHRDVIGSIRAGTLHLEVRSDGLDYTIDVASTHAGDDAIELVRSGLAPFSSFGFHCFDESWSYDDGMPVRHLVSGQLTEVSVVSNPAYLDSTAALRSLASHVDAPLDDVIACGGDYSRFFNRTDVRPAPAPAPALAEVRTNMPQGRSTTDARRQLEKMKPQAISNKQRLLGLLKARFDWHTDRLSTAEARALLGCFVPPREM